MNTHPFEITEIIELIAEDLDIRDLFSLLQVSRTLYGAIIPFVWRVINLRPVVGSEKCYLTGNTLEAYTNHTPTDGILERHKNHISLNGVLERHKNHIPADETLERYRGYIQEIHFPGLCPPEFLRLQACPRLHTLAFWSPRTTLVSESSSRAVAPTLFLKFAKTHSSTLRSIKIEFKLPSSLNLWGVLAGFPALTDLDLTWQTVMESDWPLFLQLWGRLRSFSFSHGTIDPRPARAYEVAGKLGTEVNGSGNGSGSDSGSDSDSNSESDDVNIRGPRELSFEGSNFRRLSERSNGVADLVDLIRKNRTLKSLRWRWSTFHHEPSMLSTCECCEIFRTLSKSPWSLTSLQSLDLHRAFVSDELLSAVLNQIYHLKTLKASRTKFGPLCYNTLIGEGNALTLDENLGTVVPQPRRLCKTIETLYIDNCPKVTGAMILRLLASCSNLKYFSADKVTVREIARAQHWACKEMRHLEIYVCADDDWSGMNETASQGFMKMQRYAFEKLNTLTKLQRLVLTNGVQEFGQRRKRTLDLRVRAGLGLLRGLKELREFSFQSEIPQMMNTEEALWIADHWPKIKCIEGPWNQDPEACMKMMAIVGPIQTSISKRK